MSAMSRLFSAPTFQQARVKRRTGGDQFSSAQREFTSNLQAFREALQYLWEQHAAPEQVEEGPVMYIETYFLDGERVHDCTHSRPVRLRGAPITWELSGLT